jgi:hypothetical protein
MCLLLLTLVVVLRSCQRFSLIITAITASLVIRRIYHELNLIQQDIINAAFLISSVIGDESSRRS